MRIISSRPVKRDTTFTSQEITLALGIISRLDPAIFTHPDAKSLIHKAQGWAESGGDAYVVRT